MKNLTKNLFQPYAPLGGNLEPVGSAELRPLDNKQGRDHSRATAIAAVLAVAGLIFLGEFFSTNNVAEKAPSLSPQSSGTVERVVVPEAAQVRYVVPDMVTVASVSVPVRVSVVRSVEVVPAVEVASVVRDVVDRAQVSSVVTVTGEVNAEVA